MEEENTLPWWPFAAAAGIAVVGVLAAVFWPHGTVSLHLADRGNAATRATVADVPTGTPYAVVAGVTVAPRVTVSPYVELDGVIVSADVVPTWSTSCVRRSAAPLKWALPL